jgi:hypothetical protein
MSAFEQQALDRYIRRLGAWLAAQAMPHRGPARVEEAWLRWAIDFARRHGIIDEADVAELSYLILANDKDWLNGESAREILQSQRDGALKVFQLRYLTSHGAARG